MELGPILGTLMLLRTPEAIRLAVPMVFEEGDTINHGDYENPSPGKCAAATLSGMLISGKPSNPDQKGWQLWWQQNKNLTDQQLQVLLDRGYKEWQEWFNGLRGANLPPIPPDPVPENPALDAEAVLRLAGEPPQDPPPAEQPPPDSHPPKPRHHPPNRPPPALRRLCRKKNRFQWPLKRPGTHG